MGVANLLIRGICPQRKGAQGYLGLIGLQVVKLARMGGKAAAPP